MHISEKALGPNISGGVFKTVGSKLGQLIGRDFSPAVFSDEKMRRASLQYYVGDRRTILMVVPKLAKMLDQLPNGKVLFFHCVENSLSKEEICDFFNKVCHDVPFKLTPDTLKEIGTIPYSRGVQDGVKHTYYAFDLDEFEPTEKKSKVDIGDIKEQIVDEFDAIKTLDDDLQEADVSAKVAQKADLEKYFRRDKTGLEKLDPESVYFVIFAHGGEMDPNGVAKLANDVNKEVKYGMKSGKYTPADVVKVGSIRKMYPKTSSFENYDVFAVKVG